MSRPKGSKNNSKPLVVETFSYTTEQRIRLFAHLIVEKILEDQRNGRIFLKVIRQEDVPKQ